MSLRFDLNEPAGLALFRRAGTLWRIGKEGKPVGAMEVLLLERLPAWKRAIDIAVAAVRIMLNDPIRLIVMTRVNDASACGPSLPTTRAAGATPVIEVRHSRINREALRATNHRHARLTRDLELFRMKKMQAYIAVRGSNNIFESSDVPAAKMTTRFFSRWRTARRRM